MFVKDGSSLQKRVNINIFELPPPSDGSWILIFWGEAKAGMSSFKSRFLHPKIRCKDGSGEQVAGAFIARLESSKMDIL